MPARMQRSGAAHLRGRIATTGPLRPHAGGPAPAPVLHLRPALHLCPALHLRPALRLRPYWRQLPGRASAAAPGAPGVARKKRATPSITWATSASVM